MDSVTPKISTVGGAVLDKILEVSEEWLYGTYVNMAHGLEPLFRSMLVLYILFIGWKIMTHKDFDGKSVILTIVSIGVAHQFLNDFGLFKTYIFNPLFSFTVNYTNSFLGNSGGQISDIFVGVDSGFARVFNSLETYQANQKNTSWFSIDIAKFFISIGMTILFAVLYLTFTLLMILPFFSLYVMLGLSPIMILFAGFDATRPFFKNWYKTILAYCLTPIFTAIIMGMTLKFLEDVAKAIEKIPSDGSLFIPEVGMIFIVGGVSLFLHLKATEYATQITSANIGSLGGFIASATGIAMTGAGAVGATGAIRAMRSATYKGAGKGISSASKSIANNIIDKFPTKPPKA